MQKILLFYKFTPLADPEAIRLWQRSICERYDLRGRVLLSSHGINGTLGGDIDGLKAYVKETKQFGGFKGMKFKWSDGNINHFPKLSIRVRDEIVTFGASDEISVDEQGIVNGGVHLKPEQVHELVEKRGNDVVFLDGWNSYEAAIGRFKNAITPNIRHTRDFIAELEKPEYDQLKDKAVVTYCTGGIRCEVLSTLMKKRGFKEVYQIDGGIIKYGEKYADDGLWEGALYVFDGRIKTRFSDKSKDIGQCIHCQAKTSNYENCALKSCNNLVLICENCRTSKEVCSDVCQDQLAPTG